MSISSTNGLRVVVAQLGARRHYLVPVCLYRSGMLEHFYTDFYLGGRALRSASRRISSAMQAGALRRMAARSDDELPAELVTSFPMFGLSYKASAYFAKRKNALTKVWLWGGRRLGNLVASQGFGSADAVFAYSSAALEIFEAAKAQGKLCILDQATAPKRFEDELVKQQDVRYPGWSSAPLAKDEWADEYADRQNREIHLADIVLCGSTFVKDAVQRESGQGTKCRVVPLGLRAHPKNVRPKSPIADRPLRILFVGDDAIRKGIADFCRAIELFGRKRCEARVAGNVDLSKYGRRCASRVVDLLGPVPRSEMRMQYEWADLCILPSVSDTFGLVVIEAMAHGVPVITTRNVGASDAIGDGINGFVTPAMEPELIADRIATLDNDRGLLASFSEMSLCCSRNFTVEAYGRNLVSAISAVRENRLTSAVDIPPHLICHS